MNYEKLSRVAREEVGAALAALPGPVRAEVDKVPVFLERYPDAGDIARGVHSDTLGFFDEGSPDAPTPRIRLWLETLWAYSGEEEAVFREEVRTTLLHEIGHFLGWDEEEVEDRGLG